MAREILRTSRARRGPSLRRALAALAAPRADVPTTAAPDRPQASAAGRPGDQRA